MFLLVRSRSGALYGSRRHLLSLNKCANASISASFSPSLRNDRITRPVFPSTLPSIPLRKTLFQCELQTLKETHSKQRHVRVADIDKLLQALLPTEPVSLGDGLQLLTFCGNAMPEENSLTKKALSDNIISVIGRHCVLDISHFNTVLLTYIENCLDFRPVDFLEMVASYKVQPNRVTYQRLIWRYCDSGDLPAAESLFNMMQRKGLKVNENAYGAMIFGYLQKGDEENAQKMADLLRRSGDDDELSDYYIRLNYALGFAATHNKDRLEDLLKSSKSKGVKFNNDDLFSIGKMLALKSQNKLPITKIREYLQPRPELHIQSICSMLQLITAQRFDVAFEVLKNNIDCLCKKAAPFDFENNSEKDAFSNSAVVHFMSHAVRMECPNDKVFGFAESLLRLGHAADVELFQHILLASFRTNRLDLALEVIERMRTENMPLKLEYFRPPVFHNAARGNLDGVVDLIELMHSCNIEMDTSFYDECVASGTLSLPQLLSKTNVLNHIVPPSQWAIFQGQQPSVVLLKNVYASFLKRTDSQSRKQDLAVAESIILALQKMGSADAKHPRALMLLCEMYACLGDLSKALGYYYTVIHTCPGFKASLDEVLLLATLMIKNDRAKDVLHFLKSQLPQLPDAKKFVFPPAAEKFLFEVLDFNDESLLSSIVTLIAERLCLQRNKIYVPCILAYANRKQYAKATDLWVTFTRAYQATAGVGPLLQLLIKNGDPDNNIRQIFELTATLKGPASAALTVALAFLNCGAIKQAQKLLTEKSLKFDKKLLDSWFLTFVADKEVTIISRFLEATRQSQVPRNLLFHYLILAQVNSNNWVAAEDTWLQMQEEGVLPIPETLACLKMPRNSAAYSR